MYCLGAASAALCQFTCWLPGLGRPTFRVQKPAELIPVEFSLLVTSNILDYRVMLILSLYLSVQDLLVVVACWTIMELLSGVLRASPDASHLNIDIYIYL